MRLLAALGLAVTVGLIIWAILSNRPDTAYMNGYMLRENYACASLNDVWQATLEGYVPPEYVWHTYEGNGSYIVAVRVSAGCSDDSPASENKVEEE